MFCRNLVHKTIITKYIEIYKAFKSTGDLHSCAETQDNMQLYYALFTMVVVFIIIRRFGSLICFRHQA
jgi:hypothetical protein